MPTTTRRVRKKARGAPARRISESAIVAATGRGSAHWARVLDRFARGRALRSKPWSHRDAAAHLEREHALAPWWAQMTTVEYERARGIREVHQRAKGFGVDVQRTVASPATTVFAAFSDAKALSTWLTARTRHAFEVGGRYSNAHADRGEYLAIVAPRRIRMSWDNPLRFPGSVVEFVFDPKGGSKTAVRVSHERLPDAKAVAAMRTGWAWALHSLGAYLATGKGVRFTVWRSSRE